MDTKIAFNKMTTARTKCCRPPWCLENGRVEVEPVDRVHKETKQKMPGIIIRLGMGNKHYTGWWFQPSWKI